MNIKDLNLSPIAEAGAHALQAAFPWLIFTSGRRDLRQQAHAMAVNTFSNKNWVADTYKNPGTIPESIYKYYDIVPVKYLDLTWNISSIEAVIYHDLSQMSESQQHDISRHLTGDAFDCQWEDSLRMNDVVETSKELNGCDKVLTNEAGHLVLHVQFVYRFSTKEV